MMHSARLVLCALAALCLSACLQEGSGGAADSPEAAILSSVEALKGNDVKAFLESAMPPEAIAEMRAEFEKNRSQMSDSDAAQFNEMMAKLTADGAADQLFAEAQPQLAQMAPQLPFLVGMVRGMGASSIQEQENLSDVEKENARKALDALGNWVEGADLTSEDNLRRAIEATVSTGSQVGPANGGSAPGTRLRSDARQSRRGAGRR